MADGSIQHLSVFAAAPQPLLVLLGALLSDIPAADVYQLHREPVTWRWQPLSDDSEFQIEEPTNLDGPPALVISLSATITTERVTAVLRNPTIWRVTIPCPNNDFLRSWEQAQEFRRKMRALLDRIKSRHGTDSSIHVLPAMPVALAVELGRIIMPKADLPLHIYDENRAQGGFVYAITVPGGTRGGCDLMPSIPSKAFSGELEPYWGALPMRKRDAFKQGHEKAVADQLLEVLKIEATFERNGEANKNEPVVIYRIEGRTVGIEVATAYSKIATRKMPGRSPLASDLCYPTKSDQDPPA